MGYCEAYDAEVEEQIVCGLRIMKQYGEAFRSAG
jgi:hypothetical protein